MGPGGTHGFRLARAGPGWFRLRVPDKPPALFSFPCPGLALQISSSWGRTLSARSRVRGANEGNFANKSTGCCKVRNKGLAEPKSSHLSKKAERRGLRTRAAADSAAAAPPIAAALTSPSLPDWARPGSPGKLCPGPRTGWCVRLLAYRPFLSPLDLSSSCGSQDFLGLGGRK